MHPSNDHESVDVACRSSIMMPMLAILAIENPFLATLHLPFAEGVILGASWGARTSRKGHPFLDNNVLVVAHHPLFMVYFVLKLGIIAPQVHPWFLVVRR